MKEAFYFVEDFQRLARDLGTNFISDEAALKHFRGRWTNRAIEVEFQDFNGRNFDLTEVYSFEDGSVAYLKNPKQEAHPANAYVFNQ